MPPPARRGCSGQSLAPNQSLAPGSLLIIMEQHKIVCIDCPTDCVLTVEAEGSEVKNVTGHKCKRGINYAQQELVAPVRTISSTVKTAFLHAPRLPVRVSVAFDKSRVMDVMAEINKITVKKPVKRGDILIKNVLGLGTDIIVTSDLCSEAT